jgi:hypothetical protein
MKILIDECSPKALKRHLADHGHECLTVQEAGWAGKKNGELLDLAEPRFDVLVTLDTRPQNSGGGSPLLVESTRAPPPVLSGMRVGH